MDNDGGSDTATVKNDKYDGFIASMYKCVDDGDVEQMGHILARQVAGFAQDGSAYGVRDIEMWAPSAQGSGSKTYMVTLRASRAERFVSLKIVDESTRNVDLFRFVYGATPSVWDGERLGAIAAKLKTISYLPGFKFPSAAGGGFIGLPVLQMCTFFCLSKFHQSVGYTTTCDLDDVSDAFKLVFNYTPVPPEFDLLSRGEASPEQKFARDVAPRVLDPGNQQHNGRLPWYAKTFDMTAEHAAEVCIAASRTIEFNTSKAFGPAMAKLFMRLHFKGHVRPLVRRALRQAKRHLEFLRDTLRYCGDESDAVARCAQGQDYEAAVIAADNYPVYGLLVCGAVMRALYKTSVEFPQDMHRVVADPDLCAKLMSSCTSDAFLGKVASYVARNLVSSLKDETPAYTRLLNVRLAIAPLVSYAIGDTVEFARKVSSGVVDRMLKPVKSNEDVAASIFRQCAHNTVRMCSMRGESGDNMPMMTDICQSSRYRASLPPGAFKHDADTTQTTEEYDTWLLTMAAYAFVDVDNSKVTWKLRQHNLPPPNSDALWLNTDVVVPLGLFKAEQEGRMKSHAALLVEASLKHVGFVHYRFKRLMRLYPNNALLPAMYLEACLSIRHPETLYVCVVDPCTHELQRTWCPHNWLLKALTDAVDNKPHALTDAVDNKPHVILDYFGADCGDGQCTSLQKAEPSCGMWQCVMYDVVARFGADNFDYVMNRIGKVHEGRNAYYIMLMHLNNGTISVSMATVLLMRTFGLVAAKLAEPALGVVLPEGRSEDLAWLAALLNTNMSYTETIDKIRSACEAHAPNVPPAFRPLAKFHAAVQLSRNAQGASILDSSRLRHVERVSQLHLRVRQALPSDRDWDVSQNMANSCCAVMLGHLQDASSSWGKVGMTGEIYAEAIDLAGAGCTVLVNTNAHIEPRLTGEYGKWRSFVWLSGKDATWQHALMFYIGLGRQKWVPDDGDGPGSERLTNTVQIFRTYAQRCNLSDFNVNVRGAAALLSATGDYGVRVTGTKDALRCALLKYIIATPNLVKCVYYASDADVEDTAAVPKGGAVGVACVHPSFVSPSVDYLLFKGGGTNSYVRRIAQFNVDMNATKQNGAYKFIRRARSLIFTSKQNLDFARHLLRRCAGGAGCFVAPIESWDHVVVLAFLVDQQVPMKLFTHFAERKIGGADFVKMCVVHTADHDIKKLGLNRRPDESRRRSLLELVRARGARDFTEPMDKWSYGKARNFFGRHVSPETIDALVPREPRSGRKLCKLVFTDHILAQLNVRGSRRPNPMRNWGTRDVQKFLSACCGATKAALDKFCEMESDGNYLLTIDDEDDAFLNELNFDATKLHARIAAYNKAVPERGDKPILSEPEDGQHDDAWTMGTLVYYTYNELLERLTFYRRVQFPSELVEWTHEHCQAFLSMFDVSSETRNMWDSMVIDGRTLQQTFNVSEGRPHAKRAQRDLKEFLIHDSDMQLAMINSLEKLCYSSRLRVSDSPEY